MEKNKYLDITLKLMNAAINGLELDLSDYDEDDIFLEIQKEQTFLPFLYQVDKRKVWRQHYYQSYLINEKFDKLLSNIKEILDKNCIPHIFLKGSHIKKYYPAPWLRQMGDIDVLIDERDYDKAIKIFELNGFIKKDSLDYDTTFVKESIVIELHRKLMSHLYKFDNYFSDPFSHSKKIDNFTYCLNENYNFNYIVAHYIKHLEIGAGLRELCDIYLLLINHEIDINETREFLKKENCEDYIDSLLTSLNIIFQYNKVQYQYNPHSIELLNYCLISGIHGFGKNSTKAENEFIKSKKSKISYLFSILFIPIKQLHKIYPWSKSIILIPIAYIFRLVYLLTKKRKELKLVVTSNPQINILNKNGIKKTNSD